MCEGMCIHTKTELTRAKGRAVPLARSGEYIAIGNESDDANPSRVPKFLVETSCLRTGLLLQVEWQGN
jgi:hypothetical protein